MSSTNREQYAAQQTARAGTADAPPRDELDDLFDYDVDLGDVFGEIDTNMDVPVKQPSSSRAGGKENGAGLGIDEEIKIAKKRRPVVKLDETRYVPFRLHCWQISDGAYMLTCIGDYFHKQAYQSYDDLQESA